MDKSQYLGDLSSSCFLSEVGRKGAKVYSDPREGVTRASGSRATSIHRTPPSPPLHVFSSGRATLTATQQAFAASAPPGGRHDGSTHRLKQHGALLEMLLTFHETDATGGAASSLSNQAVQ